jgi:hypothetical protein
MGAQTMARPLPCPRCRRSRLLRRGLLTGGVALALVVLPVTLAPGGGSLDLQTAEARGGSGGGGGGGAGGSGGGGGGPGGGHGFGGADRGPGGSGFAGGGRGPGGEGPPGLSQHGSFGEFVQSMRGGGGGERGADFAGARERSGHAVDKPRGGGRPDQVTRPATFRGPDHPGPAAYRFAPRETRHLIETGWQPRRKSDDGFRNHGERVRTMVELARRLGHGAHVGALQANFGTPYENGIAALQGELDHAREQLRSDPHNPELRAEVRRLETELQAAIAAAKPGWGPDDGWATVDLDVNGDGVVDARDLEALDSAERG